LYHTQKIVGENPTPATNFWRMPLGITSHWKP